MFLRITTNSFTFLTNLFIPSEVTPYDTPISLLMTVVYFKQIKSNNSTYFKPNIYINFIITKRTQFNLRLSTSYYYCYCRVSVVILKVKVIVVKYNNYKGRYIDEKLIKKKKHFRATSIGLSEGRNIH